MKPSNVVRELEHLVRNAESLHLDIQKLKFASFGHSQEFEKIEFDADQLAHALQAILSQAGSP